MLNYNLVFMISLRLTQNFVQLLSFQAIRKLQVANHWEHQANELRSVALANLHTAVKATSVEGFEQIVRHLMDTFRVIPTEDEEEEEEQESQASSRPSRPSSPGQPPAKRARAGSVESVASVRSHVKPSPKGWEESPFLSSATPPLHPDASASLESLAVEGEVRLWYNCTLAGACGCSKDPANPCGGCGMTARKSYNTIRAHIHKVHLGVVLKCPHCGQGISHSPDVFNLHRGKCKSRPSLPLGEIPVTTIPVTATATSSSTISQTALAAMQLQASMIPLPPGSLPK